MLRIFPGLVLLLSCRWFVEKAEIRQKAGNRQIKRGVIRGKSRDEVFKFIGE